MHSIKEYMSNLSEFERLLFCRHQLNECIKALKSMNKAISAEFNHTGDRGGRMSARNQTLVSKSHNTSKIYHSCIEDLKESVRNL